MKYGPVTCHWLEPVDQVTGLYRRDTGETLWLRDAKAGDMWYADWMSARGPDDHCLQVMLPCGHDWSPDRCAANTKQPWQRSGAPPKISVTPSIGCGPQFQCYHGWLRDGVLNDA